MNYKIKRVNYGKGWAVVAWQQGRWGYVRRVNWPAGLTPEMDIVGARSVVKSINDSERIVDEEARRLGALKRLEREEKTRSAWLPKDVVEHFERIHLHPKKERPGYQKLLSMWRLCQKLITDVNMDPAEWPDEPLPIYAWFEAHPKSADYVRRLCRLVNKYGRTYCRKRGHAFEAFPNPPEEVLIEVAERFNGARKSKPLLPEHLALLKQRLNEREYNYVRITYAFGLRPEETDLLLTPREVAGRRRWWTEDNDTTLVVDQPKLRRVPKSERYKRIPAFTKEMLEALALVLAGEFARPEQRRVRRVFPQEVTLYGCRHGFTRYHDSLKRSIFDISRWLGHRSIKTTEKYYRDHGLKVVAELSGDKAA